MIRQIAPKVVAFAVGFAVVVSPAAVLPAFATPSIPIPPPSGGPRGTGKTLPAEVIVHDLGAQLEVPSASANEAVQYPLSEELPR
jgi:hypothetical protein